MATDDQPEPERPEGHGPTRRSVLQAGAMGVAVWSVPTIRPIAKLATPGSRPPTTRSQSVSDESTTTDSTSDSNDPVSDQPTTTGPPTTDDSVGGLHVSGPARPVTGEPDFTG
jgi:hypothetical protein